MQGYELEMLILGLFLGAIGIPIGWFGAIWDLNQVRLDKRVNKLGLREVNYRAILYDVGALYALLSSFTIGLWSMQHSSSFEELEKVALWVVRQPVVYRGIMVGVCFMASVSWLVSHRGSRKHNISMTL